MFVLKLLHKVFSKQQDVWLSLPQWRHKNREHIEPVVKIFSKLALSDGLFQDLVGSDDESHVDLDSFSTAQSFKLSFLQHSQQFYLSRKIKIADLVQKQCAAVGQLKPAFLARLCPGEGPLFITK